MNNAGLPGTGLGGLLYLVLALVMPLVELVRVLRGRERWGWRPVLVQFALACGIVLAVVGTLVLLVQVADLPTVRPGTALVGPLGALTALLLLVVVLRGWAAVDGRRRDTPSGPGPVDYEPRHRGEPRPDDPVGPHEPVPARPAGPPAPAVPQAPEDPDERGSRDGLEVGASS